MAERVRTAPGRVEGRLVEKDEEDAARPGTECSTRPGRVIPLPIAAAALSLAPATTGVPAATSSHGDGRTEYAGRGRAVDDPRQPPWGSRGHR